MLSPLPPMMLAAPSSLPAQVRLQLSSQPCHLLCMSPLHTPHPQLLQQASKKGSIEVNPLWHHSKPALLWTECPARCNNCISKGGIQAPNWGQRFSTHHLSSHHIHSLQESVWCCQSRAHSIPDSCLCPSNIRVSLLGNPGAPALHRWLWMKASILYAGDPTSPGQQRSPPGHERLQGRVTHLTNQE